MAPRRDPLSRYRQKRPAGRSPEPPGETGASQAREDPAASGGGAFAVHLHAARRRHYDLRLELDGVLASWAVPKGPALDPAEKRLAVHVEDHPLEYIDFEGVIPEGQYGAGAMILWDRGVWVPLEDPAAGLEKGKLLFELRGHKLKGVWTLVKLKKKDAGTSPKDDEGWLLIRERRGAEPPADAANRSARDADGLAPESVLSGLTVEELASGLDPAPPLRKRLEALGAPRRQIRPGQVRMMLAQARDRPFSRQGWLFEVKLDGYRMLAGCAGRAARLVTRNGNDATDAFPDLTLPLSTLPYGDLVLDGEVVVHRGDGLPSFQGLQKRALLRRPLDIRRAARLQPATYYVFDILAAEGFDLRPLPLVERKRILHDILPPVGPVRYVDHFEERGVELYEQAVAMGLEGIVGKAAESRYKGGRSKEWIKVRADRTDDFVIVGYTLPQGSRAGFGALHLAGYRDGELIYAGRAGSGFTDRQLAELKTELDRGRRPDPPCAGPVPSGSEHRWVHPTRVCEVRYRESTEEGLLRQPVFLRMRDDKSPQECVLPPSRAEATGEEPFDDDDPDGSAMASDPRPAEVTLTNPEKVFWPEEGYTKKDLFEYYRAVAPWLLPYLRDRPLVLTRYPDGIEGKSFYQKDAPDFIPGWIRTEGIWSEGSDREIAYFICDDVETLLYVANLGTIPLHVWHSRAGTLETPDWCVLDLDPKGAPFDNVVEVAKSIYLICKDIDLPCFVKTSGSTGLHVLLPLDGRVDYEGSRALGEVLARVVARERPEIATIERVISDREGKVYVDFLQNPRGQLIVAPYSVRPLAGAPVSTPLRWREVRPGLDLRKFTIESVPKRLARMRDDPLQPVLTEKPDLARVLGRLAERLTE